MHYKYLEKAVTCIYRIEGEFQGSNFYRILCRIFSRITVFLADLYFSGFVYIEHDFHGFVEICEILALKNYPLYGT